MSTCSLVPTYWPPIPSYFRITISMKYFWRFSTISLTNNLEELRSLGVEKVTLVAHSVRKRGDQNICWRLYRLSAHVFYLFKSLLEHGTDQRSIHTLREGGWSVYGTLCYRYFFSENIIWIISGSLGLVILTRGIKIWNGGIYWR